MEGLSVLFVTTHRTAMVTAALSHMAESVTMIALPPINAPYCSCFRPRCTYSPAGSTVAYFDSIAFRGTLTWLNWIHPLSRPTKVCKW